MIDETREVLENEAVETLEEITAVEMAWKYFLANKNKVRVAVQIAPAVRVAIGEAFGLDRGEDAMGKIVAALKLLGADVVVDGAIAEDVISIAESQEIKWRKEEGGVLPVISSRCSKFVQYMQQTHPELLGYLMQGPSPMQALSMLIKKYYDKVDDGKVTKVIAVVPCRAKESELSLGENVRAATDLVLTTKDVVELLQQADFNLVLLEKQAMDLPFGISSGCGYISNIAGGAAETMLRTFSKDKSDDALRKIAYSGVRGWDNFREASIDVEGEQFKVAVACGLDTAEQLLTKIVNGEASYDYMEVVACEGGPIGGDAQPYDDPMTLKLRALGLQYIDSRRAARSPEMSAAVSALYNTYSRLRWEKETIDPEVDLTPEVVECAPIVEEVVEEVVEEPTVEETVEEVVEEPIFEEVVEEIVEEPIVEEVVEEIVEEPIVEEVVEEIIEEPTVEEVVEEVVEEPTVEETVEEVIEEPIVEETVEEVVEEPIVEETVEEVIEEPTVEEVVEEIIEEPIVEEVVEEIIEEPIIEEVVEEVIEEPIVEETVEEVVEEPTVEEVVEEPTVEEVVEEVVEEPIVEEVVEEIIEEPIVEEVVEEIVEEPIVEEVVEEIVEEPTVEEVVEEIIEEPIVEEVVEEIIEEPIVEEVAVAETVAEEMEEMEDEEIDDEELTEEEKRNPYYRRLSRKERRKLKRMRRFNKSSK